MSTCSLYWKFYSLSMLLYLRIWMKNSDESFCMIHGWQVIDRTFNLRNINDVPLVRFNSGLYFVRYETLQCGRH